MGCGLDLLPLGSPSHSRPGTTNLPLPKAAPVTVGAAVVRLSYKLRAAYSSISIWGLTTTVTQLVRSLCISWISLLFLLSPSALEQCCQRVSTPGVVELINTLLKSTHAGCSKDAHEVSHNDIDHTTL